MFGMLGAFVMVDGERTMKAINDQGTKPRLSPPDASEEAESKKQ
jgi:hypothetical protein